MRRPTLRDFSTHCGGTVALDFDQEIVRSLLTVLYLHNMHGTLVGVGGVAEGGMHA